MPQFSANLPQLSTIPHLKYQKTPENRKKNVKKSCD